MLFEQTIAVCSQILTKYTNTLCEQDMESFNVKPGGTYSYYKAFKAKLNSAKYSYIQFRIICINI
jgi:hypothetical protein